MLKTLACLFVWLQTQGVPAEERRRVPEAEERICRGICKHDLQVGVPLWVQSNTQETWGRWRTNSARYKELDSGQSVLTYEELNEGWHFCPEWDEMLLCLGETEPCSCESYKGAIV